MAVHDVEGVDAAVVVGGGGGDVAQDDRHDLVLGARAGHAHSKRAIEQRQLEKQIWSFPNHKLRKNFLCFTCAKGLEKMRSESGGTRGLNAPLVEGDDKERSITSF